jgi:hypothetical protein
MFRNERIVDEVRIRGTHPIEFFDLSWGQVFLRIQAQPCTHKPLLPQHFIDSCNTPVKTVRNIEEGRIHIGDLVIAQKPLLRNRLSGGGNLSQLLL